MANKKARKERSASFTKDEVAILVEEVQQFQGLLFGGTRGVKDLVARQRCWEAIAMAMAPSSPCGLRDWTSVRKKWQDMSSQVKKKGWNHPERGQGHWGWSTRAHPADPR